MNRALACTMRREVGMKRDTVVWRDVAGVPGSVSLSAESMARGVRSAAVQAHAGSDHSMGAAAPAGACRCRSSGMPCAAAECRNEAQAPPPLALKLQTAAES